MSTTKLGERISAFRAELARRSDVSAVSVIVAQAPTYPRPKPETVTVYGGVQATCNGATCHCGEAISAIIHQYLEHIAALADDESAAEALEATARIVREKLAALRKGLH